MAEIPLSPITGMNTEGEDTALQVRSREGSRLFLRDALNVDLTPAGAAKLRAAPARATAQPLRDLWQSPLHGDVFGVLGTQWVRVNPVDWSTEPLAEIGEDASHAVLNGAVCAAGPAGIFAFDGAHARRLTVDTPSAPMVLAGAGALPAGTYGVALAWLRGTLESATSPVTSVEVGADGGLHVTAPLALDPGVTRLRLYVSRQNGGELLAAGDYPVDVPISLPLLPAPGRAAPSRHLSPMPTGRWLRVWRGRLLTARANVLRWSEALSYHLHDERHGFVQMPQRISFVEPVDGGIWIGQTDHVAFLRGTDPGALALETTAGAAPVFGSSAALDADAAGPLLEGARDGGVLWLAANGFVLGTSDGRIIAPSAGMLAGISAQSGSTAAHGRRVLSALQ